MRDGYFWYQARSDDMIISSGYNIAGPEVEAALLTHPAVAECGVVGAPDEERGQIVKAYVVLRAGHDRRRGADQGSCRITSRRRSRPTNIRARSNTSPSCRDPDRQAAALRAAQAARPRAPRASWLHKENRVRSPTKTVVQPRPGLAARRRAMPTASRRAASSCSSAAWSAGTRTRNFPKASSRRRARRCRTSWRCWRKAAPSPSTSCA